MAQSGRKLFNIQVKDFSFGTASLDGIKDIIPTASSKLVF